MTSWLIIDKVPPDPEPLREWVTDGEWATASGFKDASRRAEWLSWRAIVRRRLGAHISITYNPQGAPQITDGFISISHTKGYVAVLWSAQPCAVDIELSSRTISPSVTSRYGISSVEDWCAHEATIKYTSLTDSPIPAARIFRHGELVVAVCA